MDNSSRQRIFATSNRNNNRRQLPEHGTSSATTSLGEITGRVVQLALVQSTLQNRATPTLVAGIAISIAQLQAQTDYQDLVLTVFSGIGSLVRAASFQDGVWHSYNLTHSIADPRSRSTYSEPTRPLMEQKRSLRMQPLTTPSPLIFKWTCVRWISLVFRWKT